MKNICFITQCSLPVPTTKGGAVETLVEYILSENEKYGKYHFTVISIMDKQAEEISKTYKYTDFVYINESNKNLNSIILQLYRVLKHLNIYIPFSEEFHNALKLLKKLDKQDLYIFEAGPTTQLPALNKIIPKEKLAVHLHWDGMGNAVKDRCFSYLIPISDYIGNQWQNASGCSKDKIKPLYNCAKIERFTRKCTESEKQSIRSKLGIPPENKVIIFTGRIVKEKGVKELLTAYEQLETPNTTLMIIGSANFGAKTNTPYEQEIQTIIANMKKSVVFTGYIHQEKLYKYYSIADIAVMPSVFQEPAGLVCIEAQATGTPLIATRTGGLPEYAGKDCTILVENDSELSKHLKDEMDKLLNDDAKRAKMKENGLKYAVQFNTEVYFKNFSELADSIM